MILLVLLACSCGHISGGGDFQDNCEKQGGTWVSNPNFIIEVPVVKDGTVVTVKRVATQEFCEFR